MLDKNMSDLNDLERLYPPDPPMEVTICLQGVERILHGTDTTVYRWALHPELDHVYHVYRDEEGDERQLALFGADHLMTHLEAQGFYSVVNGAISDWDVKAFLAWQSQVLEQELDEL